MPNTPQEIIDAFRQDVPWNEREFDALLDLLGNNRPAHKSFQEERNFDARIVEALTQINVPPDLDTRLRKVSRSNKND